MPEAKTDQEKLVGVADSRRITDAQVGIHANLEKVVLKHLQHKHQKPIAQHTQDAFNQLKPVIIDAIALKKPLIFDSCCGTAMSTSIIATENPDALVIGIDRSAVRLGKEYNNELPKNAWLIQAECADFWCLAKQEGWKLFKHTILYPNPYPKSKHLKRRWHGNPAFSDLLALGGDIELRTNWKVYADEFCAAASIASKEESVCTGVELIQTKKPLTLFEKKYQESGQVLYRCVIGL